MERDFMGLNPKEEFVEGGCEDSGFSRSSGVPQFMSLRGGKQDEKPTKNWIPAYPVKQQCLGGTTEQWINSKASNQLTIFYGGRVNVFDDISPEKAEAIMLLAGNVHVESKIAQSKPPTADQALNTPASCGLPSPMSVSSPPINQPDSNNTESPRLVSPSAIIPSVIPQARKASLVRFLEKRKERVMSVAAPYKQGRSGGECKTNDMGFSATSG